MRLGRPNLVRTGREQPHGMLRAGVDSGSPKSVRSDRWSAAAADEEIQGSGRRSLRSPGEVVGLEDQWKLRPSLATCGEIKILWLSPLKPLIPIHGIDRVSVMKAVCEARHVRHEMPDKHRKRLRFSHWLLNRTRSVHGCCRKRRNELCDGVFKLNETLLNKLHCGNRGQRFRH